MSTCPPPSSGPAARPTSSRSRPIRPRRSTASTSIRPSPPIRASWPTMAKEPAELLVVEQQFARFGASCRLFAPVYRQFTLTALVGVHDWPSAAPAPARGRPRPYDDVRDAWNYYLAHDNHGRGVVLIGHSQGSGVLTELIKREIDGKPEQKQLVSAILMGTQPGRPRQAATWAATSSPCPCAMRPARLGCAIAYASFRDTARRRPIRASAGRARRAGPGGRLRQSGQSRRRRGSRCTPIWPPRRRAIAAAAPSSRRRGSRARRSPRPSSACPACSAPSAPRRPSSTTSPSTSTPTRRPRTSDINGDVVFGGQVQKDWGLHLIDANLAMGNLVAIVRAEGRAWRREDADRAGPPRIWRGARQEVHLGPRAPRGGDDSWDSLARVARRGLSRPGRYAPGRRSGRAHDGRPMAPERDWRQGRLHPHPHRKHRGRRPLLQAPLACHLAFPPLEHVSVWALDPKGGPSSPTRSAAGWRPSPDRRVGRSRPRRRTARAGVSNRPRRARPAARRPEGPRDLCHLGPFRFLGRGGRGMTDGAMSQKESPAEVFKRALAHAARSLAEQPDLEVVFSGDGPSPHRPPRRAAASAARAVRPGDHPHPRPGRPAGPARRPPRRRRPRPRQAEVARRRRRSTTRWSRRASRPSAPTRWPA